MKKVATRKSRKKPGWFRRVLMGPPAAVVAALVGGTFTLTSAIVPRVLFPAKETAPPITEPATITTTAIPIVITVPEVIVPVHQPAEAPPASAPRVIAATAAPGPIPFGIEKLVSSLTQAEEKEKTSLESEVRLLPPAKHHPNLTYGVWTIFASKDMRGTIWNNSTLKITSQQETRDGLQIAGFLDWRANGKSAGREYIVGNYDEDTRSLFFEGRRSAGSDRMLALSSCSARLSDDGRRLTNGTWGSVSAHRPATPGRWEARR